MRLSTILRARGFTFAYHFSLAPYTKPRIPCTASHFCPTPYTKQHPKKYPFLGHCINSLQTAKISPLFLAAASNPPPTAKISALFLAVLIIIFIAVHRITDLVYETEFLNGAVQRITYLVYEKGFPTDAVHRITALVYGESQPARTQQAQSGQSSPRAELRRPL